MGLTDQEKATLEALSKKAKEPDPPPLGRSVSISVNMDDAEQVAKAQKWGFLPPDEEPPAEGGEGGESGESGEDQPQRGGFFGKQS